MAGKGTGKPGPNPGDPRSIESGRRGGLARSADVGGPEGFRELGRLGGIKRREQLGSDGFRELARAGAAARRDGWATLRAERDARVRAWLATRPTDEGVMERARALAEAEGWTVNYARGLANRLLKENH